MQLVWFRNDLRINDNPALWHAREAGEVAGVFVLTPGQWRRHGMASCRLAFILRTLAVLRTDLNDLGIPLLVVTANDFAEIPALLARLCRQYRAGALFFNREYGIDEMRRDQAVSKHLNDLGVAVQGYDDRVIAPPGAVVKDNGEPYKVFTPFKKRWLQLMEAGLPDLLPAPKTQRCQPREQGDIPTHLPAFEGGFDDTLWPPGEREAQRRLAAFCHSDLDDYHLQRDLPNCRGTSQLSPYLAIGAISPQQCLLAAYGRPGEGSRTWISELIWRDFYQHLLVAFPRLSMHQPFKPETEQVPWRNADGQARSDFDAWCQGKTGVPIVDAGMRELRATGWMHNRVRMIVAMFLTKNLLIDWRQGEAFFMAHLIDGDLAANNGGWQWSASTGTDAVPYFRIFNPFSQARRFDPRAVYIKAHVPELGSLSPEAIHDPGKLAKQRPADYPAMVVDPGLSRKRAIEAFRQAGA